MSKNDNKVMARSAVDQGQNISSYVDETSMVKFSRLTFSNKSAVCRLTTGTGSESLRSLRSTLDGPRIVPKMAAGGAF